MEKEKGNMMRRGYGKSAIFGGEFCSLHLVRAVCRD
jgi:hypothetical protein